VHETRSFDLSCRRCARLARYLDQVRREHPAYHAKPVPSFGDARPRLLVVGLAPGLHGANRTGRPFTGDHAGRLLYEALHRHGYASAPVSRSRDDELTLMGARITNAVRCVPPENKPTTGEVGNCNSFLAEELAQMPQRRAVLALGVIAHGAVLKALGLRPGAYSFAHGAVHALPGDTTLFDSYHCSRYNTQTGRLTPAMFDAVFRSIGEYLAGLSKASG
jgi:uracil-DNA glycosylase family 4